jgi:4-diphosphocytidyl-2-C-methyl-D-erythritol kinase
VQSIELIAPAKLTLSLRVLGVRPDGYHLIDAEMASLSLADVVTITEHDAAKLTVGGTFAYGVPTDESNLAIKALQLAGRTATIHIEKNIPHGGGLGGGSTDAAAVLRWAGFTHLKQAATIGADIPFCLIGGRARVTGIGEIVEPLPSQAGGENITLVVPNLHVSTPRVYQAWDELGGPTGIGPNDLEPAACHAVPELATWRTRIQALGLQPILAGSGATWFVRGHHRDLADALPDARVYYATTLA